MKMLKCKTIRLIRSVENGRCYRLDDLCMSSLTPHDCAAPSPTHSRCYIALLLKNASKGLVDEWITQFTLCERVCVIYHEAHEQHWDQ